MGIPQLNLLDDEYHLNSVLAIYTSQYRSHIEYHPVIDGEIKAAQILPEDIIIKLLKEYKLLRSKKQKEEIIKIPSIIPEGLLYCCSKSKIIIFHDVPQKRKLSFKGIKLRNKKYDIPGVVYIYKNMSIYVFAYKQWKGVNTELYDIRLPNISKNGSMCTGNISRKEKFDVLEIMNQTKETVWGTYFNHFREELTGSNKLWNNDEYDFLDKNYINNIKNFVNETLSPSTFIE